MADFTNVQKAAIERENDYGVLLYYKYTEIPNLQELYDFYTANCNSLCLLGRVRLSPHGVNVTVGGKLNALEKHIEGMKSNILFEGTDFKLASCHEPLNDQVAKECGFTSLSIRIVEELVTLGSYAQMSPEISNAGKHLSADEFHSFIQNAGISLKESNSDKKVILLDARNLYETRIGKFDLPEVETLDPKIRQYSDLPLWIDNNSEKLRGNNILMYCTGGIRCEMASAYIRSKGAGFEDVFQLYGGIQRYLEQFPDGGFFRGKNFVFDHRVSVGSSDANILGNCLLCDASYDDYSSRCRCMNCRMLVLVCGTCQKKDFWYVCELCKNGKLSLHDLSEEISKPVAYDVNSNLDQHKSITKPSRELRILCLHGFRQNASSFKGRTGSFAKKLKNIAKFVFVDAPHILPFIYQSPPNKHQNCESVPENQSPPVKYCNKKFAWLVGSDFDAQNDTEWKKSETPFDTLQYQQQTKGFEESIEYLKTFVYETGPYDGILGFSQGAAMAALVGAHREKLKGKIDFRFVILCSGFPVNMEEFAVGSVNCPSLHIFGEKEGKDRQIDCEESKRLASFFESGSKVIVEHDLGHIIPTKPPYIDDIKDFLQRFV